MFRTISANRTRSANSSTTISRCPLPFSRLNENASNTGVKITGAAARRISTTPSAHVISRLSRLIERRRYRTNARINRAAPKMPPMIRSVYTVLPGRALFDGGAPPRRRHDVVGDHAVAVLRDLVEHRLHQRLRQQVRLQPEVEELGVLRVVVVLLLLEPRVVDVLDRDLEPVGLAGALDRLGELHDREGLGELVEHAELARVGRVERGQLHALQGVDDVEVAAGLAALAVHGQR